FAGIRRPPEESGRGSRQSADARRAAVRNLDTPSRDDRSGAQPHPRASAAVRGRRNSSGRTRRNRGERIQRDYPRDGGLARSTADVLRRNGSAGGGWTAQLLSEGHGY